MGKKNREKKEKVATSVEDKPCGCTLTHFDDGTGSIRLCSACGLMEAARCLIEAANAFSNVANHVREQTNAATISRAMVDIAARKAKEATDDVQSGPAPATPE